MNHEHLLAKIYYNISGQFHIDSTGLLSSLKDHLLAFHLVEIIIPANMVSSNLGSSGEACSQPYMDNSTYACTA
jgi:hypothetical protein